MRRILSRAIHVALLVEMMEMSVCVHGREAMQCTSQHNASQEEVSKSLFLHAHTRNLSLSPVVCAAIPSLLSFLFVSPASQPARSFLVRLRDRVNLERLTEERASPRSAHAC